MNIPVIYPGRFDEIRNKSIELATTVQQHLLQNKQIDPNNDDSAFYPKPRPLPKPLDDPLKGIDVVYYINLAKSVDRRTAMETMFKDPVFNGIPIHRYNAVNGYETEGTVDNMMEITQRTITNKEYACTLSHLECIRLFSETDHPVALIMEDDMTLEYKKYWSKSIQTVIDNAPYDWEIIQLCYIIGNQFPRQTYTARHKNGFLAWSAGAYIIKNAAAKRMMNEIYIPDTKRYRLDANHHHVADSIIYEYCISYTYKFPFFVYRSDNDSTLHSDHLSWHESVKKRVTNMYQAMYPENDAAIFQDISEGFGEKDLANGPSLQYYSYMYLGMSAAFLLFFQLSKMDIVKSWYKRFFARKKIGI